MAGAMSDGHPCSTCPLLDLGHRYPTGDTRDPWRRMPGLMRQLVNLFGPAMYNHAAPTRLRIEKLLGFYCRRTREAHGHCNRERIELCGQAVLAAIKHGEDANTDGECRAYVQQALKTAVNDPVLYENLKKTRQKVKPLMELRLPPVTWEAA